MGLAFLCIHSCNYISPQNRNKEKFVCENCGYHDDADIQAAKVLAQRGKQKLGIDTLRVVSSKVTTKPELTGSHMRKKSEKIKLNSSLSSALVDESGNPAEYVQLSLFSIEEWTTG
ncbi:MAG: zinc ribbon domain-containing protein [Xenococcaceae cyanobacterium MO_234.B1]|nr:zinc ribbon domain-containing protein [Xenococcaceae cyanobacterium MO_234.B1]